MTTLKRSTNQSTSQNAFTLNHIIAHWPGLCDEAIHRVYKSVILGKLLYAVSARWGFSSAADRQRLQALLHRGIRSGLCSPD